MRRRRSLFQPSVSIAIIGIILAIVLAACSSNSGSAEFPGELTRLDNSDFDESRPGIEIWMTEDAIYLSFRSLAKFHKEIFRKRVEERVEERLDEPGEPGGCSELMEPVCRWQEEWALRAEVESYRRKHSLPSEIALETEDRVRKIVELDGGRLSSTDKDRRRQKVAIRTALLEARETSRRLSRRFMWNVTLKYWPNARLFMAPNVRFSTFDELLPLMGDRGYGNYSFAVRNAEGRLEFLQFGGLGVHGCLPEGEEVQCAVPWTFIRPDSLVLDVCKDDTRIPPGGEHCHGISVGLYGLKRCGVEGDDDDPLSNSVDQPWRRLRRDVMSEGDTLSQARVVRQRLDAFDDIPWCGGQAIGVPEPEKSDVTIGQFLQVYDQLRRLEYPRKPAYTVRPLPPEEIREETK